MYGIGIVVFWLTRLTLNFIPNPFSFLLTIPTTEEGHRCG